MCLGVCYNETGKTTIVHFTESLARLPVQMKTQDVKFIPWGRRKGETGRLPLGGWASHETIKQGKWDYYLPKFVKIPAVKFLEQDFEGKLQWFDITAGHWLQGIFLQQGNEQRIYIITFTPETPESTYLRWPRIGTG